MTVMHETRINLLIQSLQRVQSLQSNRAHVYSQFHSAFKQFMTSLDASSTSNSSNSSSNSSYGSGTTETTETLVNSVQSYAATCKTLTAQFSAISQSIRSVEAELTHQLQVMQHQSQQQSEIVNVNNDDDETKKSSQVLEQLCQKWISMIGRLQSWEKSKLELTVQMQSLQRQITVERYVLEQEQAMEQCHGGHQCSLHDHKNHKHENEHENEREHEHGSGDDGVIRGEKLAYLERDLNEVQASVRSIVEQINELVEEVICDLDDLHGMLETEQQEKKNRSDSSTQQQQHEGIFL